MFGKFLEDTSIWLKEFGTWIKKNEGAIVGFIGAAGAFWVVTTIMMHVFMFLYTIGPNRDIEDFCYRDKTGRNIHKLYRLVTYPGHATTCFLWEER